ncbi:hypothetical protein OG788_21490 [Streptomyces sp. NBC_00647]|uniref:hypothetical protein n=1 Tax=Streptomyces sp. NBC_00647 TaxID=2975796 RepID=UPI0032502A93
MSDNWDRFAWILAILAISLTLGLVVSAGIWGWTRNPGITATVGTAVWIGLSTVGLMALAILRT